MAVRELRAAGCTIVTQNYRCPAGEMDIIALEGSTLVFVEVKTRRGDRYGRPEEAITERKGQRLLRVAESYLQENRLEDVDWRVDVIAVELDAHGRLLRVEQTRNAVNGW
jgi:putative endonuclease